MCAPIGPGPLPGSWAAGGAQALRLELGTEVRELGLEMLGRLGQHERVCRELLEAGRLIEGLGVLRRHRLEGIPPHDFLEAALQDSDPALFVAVFRFCRTCVPDFEALSGTCQAALETLQLC